MIQMAMTVAEHGAFERMVGRWQGTERLHPAPHDPFGGIAAAVIVNRPILGGLMLVQEYRQSRNGETALEGHAVFRWDPADGRYAMHWFDSSGRAPAEFRGTFDDGVLVLEHRAAHGLSRASFDFRRDDRYGFRMEVSPNGVAWYPFIEGDYRRVE